MKRVGLLLALALAAPAAQAADRFDLICTSSGLAQPLRVAVDLVQGAWCEAECASPRPIAKIDPGMLVFDQSERLDRSGDPQVRFEVNRTTSEFFRLDARTEQGFVTGACTLAPFTPFPSKRF